MPRWRAAWDGAYVGLWRGPDALDTPPAFGEQGAAVDWLRARLSAAMPGIAGTGAYDDALRDAVRRFQQARGLAADGVAGPETLMALAGDAPGPHLLRVLE